MDGLFINIGYNPNTAFLPNEIKLDEEGHVLVDSNFETSIKGIFAAGDVVTKKYKQGVIAASEGCIAGLNAASYLHEMI